MFFCLDHRQDFSTLSFQGLALEEQVRGTLFSLFADLAFIFHFCPLTNVVRYERMACANLYEKIEVLLAPFYKLFSFPSRDFREENL